MPVQHKLIILLGSNMGRRRAFLKKAGKQVRKRIGSVVRSSSIYQTAAWGKTNQPDFLNQVLEIGTEFTPLACIEILLDIESGMGRVRTEKNAPRTIDLDILFYDDLILNLPNLIIPHPAITERKFVLTPLHELLPEFLHPIHKKNNTTLLQECTDLLNVKKL